MHYATEPKCNYNNCCMNEYCGCKLGRIKEMDPTCDSTAVIPSITVDSIEGITNLANCLVHVTSNNTTYYVDDKHRIVITWAGPVDIPGYDMETNPNKYKDQIVTDIEKGVAVIYDKHGKGYLFGITPDSLQEAVDKKLDEMAEDGTLEGIISSYLEDAILGFDTVADMKAATNLVAGDYARTLGFHTLNDGGGALYKISNTGTANEIDVIAIGSLYATLVPENNIIYTSQFGIIGDGTTDESGKLQVFFSENADQYVINSQSILIDDNISLTSNSKIVFNEGCSIVRKATSNNTYFILNLVNLTNVEISHAHLIGDRTTHTGTTGEWGHGINVLDCQNILIHDCSIESTWGDGIYIGTNDGSNNKNITIDNCYIDNCSRNGISACSGENILITDCSIAGIDRANPKAGVNIEPETLGSNTPSIKNLDVLNLKTSGGEYGIHFFVQNNLTCEDITIDNLQSLKDTVGIGCGRFTTTNSSIINIRNSYIGRCKGPRAISIMNKNKTSTMCFTNITIDNTERTTLSDDWDACFYIESNETDCGNIIIDNLKQVSSYPTLQSYHTIILSHYGNEKFYNLTLKNLVFKRKIFMIDKCDHQTTRLENCELLMTGSDKSTSMRNLFNFHEDAGTVYEVTTYNISNELPDGDYQIVFNNNTGTYRHIVTFDSSLKVGDNSAYAFANNEWRSGYYSGVMKFRKVGDYITMLENSFVPNT